MGKKVNYILKHGNRYFTGQATLPQRKPKVENLVALPHFSPSVDRAKIYPHTPTKEEPLPKELRNDIIRYNLAFAKIKELK